LLELQQAAGTCSTLEACLVAVCFGIDGLGVVGLGIAGLGMAGMGMAGLGRVRLGRVRLGKVEVGRARGHLPEQGVAATTSGLELQLFCPSFTVNEAVFSIH
jgi:hypothetical protein